MRVFLLSGSSTESGWAKENDGKGERASSDNRIYIFYKKGREASGTVLQSPLVTGPTHHTTLTASLLPPSPQTLTKCSKLGLPWVHRLVRIPTFKQWLRGAAWSGMTYDVLALLCQCAPDGESGNSSMCGLIRHLILQFAILGDTL
jgi:hypothetical protein